MRDAGVCCLLREAPDSTSTAKPLGLDNTMTVQTIDDTQIKSLQEHIDKAVALEPGRVEEVRTLAAQLLEQDLPVLPIVGAGASHDCGMRLATALGKDLYRDYMANPDYASEPRHAVSEDLAEVAQAIHNAAGQVAVVKAIGLDDVTLWPDAESVPEHFCLYRVLSRLAREELFKELDRLQLRLRKRGRPEARGLPAEPENDRWAQVRRSRDGDCRQSNSL